MRVCVCGVCVVGDVSAGASIAGRNDVVLVRRGTCAGATARRDTFVHGFLCAYRLTRVQLHESSRAKRDARDFTLFTGTSIFVPCTKKV